MNFEVIFPDLKIFIEKSTKLESSSFLEKITEEFRLEVAWSESSGMTVKSIRPNQESIDSFILTFRFFVQDNEPISIRNLKSLFDSQLVSKKERKKFYEIRESLNVFLNESSNLCHKNNNLSFNDILQTILYGELSHSNKEKKAKYDQWMNSIPFFQEAVWHKFMICIIFISQKIFCIKDMLLKIIIRNQKNKRIFLSYNSGNYGKITYCY